MKAEEVITKTDHYLEEVEHDFLVPSTCNNFVDRKLRYFMTCNFYFKFIQ